MNGVTAKAGYIDSTAFGTTFAKASTGLPIVSESLSTEYDKMRSKALTGGAAQKSFDLGRQIVQGDIVLEMDYSMIGILEYAFGTVSTGNFSLNDSMEKWFHFEVDKYLMRHRFQSVGVNGFTISGEAGSEDPLQLTLHCYAYGASRSATAINDVSETFDPIYFEDIAQVYVGDLDNALSSGDEVNIKSFELTVEHNQQIDGKDTSNQTNVLQNTNNDFRTVQLKLGFARYGSNQEAFEAWKAAGTYLQVQMLATNTSEIMVMSVPQCKILTGADFQVGGPGVIEGEVTLECFVNKDNTAMSSTEDQMELTFT